jgi:serine/threonine protein kinase/Tol biopolymer transport system component
MTLDAGTRLGPYQIEGPLGAGGMGQVYRAKDVRLGRDVAIKIVRERTEADPERQRRLMQEARAASALNHPNILTVYDVGVEDDKPYIVSELIDGRPLRAELDAGRLSIKRLLDLAGQVADGLAAAHEAGILHRDLKPDNVLVNKSGRVKIIDFGLAKPIVTPGAEPDGSPTETEPGLIIGTVPYMSPEQARGAAADYRSDQFSFGLVLYEMATGRAAFRRDTPVQTLSAIISEDPESIASLNPKVPAPLRWVIDRCLAKDPRQRYAATADLFHDLRMLREHLVEATTTETASAAPVRQPQRGWRRHAVPVLGLLVVALGSYTLWSLLRPAHPAPHYQTLSFGQGLVTEARFAGDGSVIYAGAWVGEAPALYQTVPGRPESRKLGVPPNSGLFSVSRSGEMAFVKNCSLNWGRCIGTLALGSSTSGAHRETLANVHEADFFPNDDKRLAVAQFADGADHIFLYPEMKELHNPRGWITLMKVSPRGDLIAFLDHPTLGHRDGSVSIVDLQGNKTELTGPWAGLNGLAWHPSGDEIWFSGSRLHLQNSGVYAVSLSKRVRDVEPPRGDIPILSDISPDGQRVLIARQFARGEIMGLGPGETKERNLTLFDFSTVGDLSRDGRTVLLYESGTGTQGRPTAYLRPTDGGSEVRLGEGKPLALSPDGRWAVALQRPEQQLVLLPTGPGNQQRTLQRGPIREYFDWAAWDPDSTLVYFAAAEEGRRSRTYVQSIQGGPPQPVTPERYVGTSLSPDGKLLTVVGGYGQIYTCPVAGCEDPEPLDSLEGESVLQWTPDSRSVFLRGAGDMVLNIFKVEVATGRRELWKKDLIPPHPVGLIGIAMDPGEVRITPDGRSYAYTYWLAPSRLFLVQNLR